MLAGAREPGDSARNAVTECCGAPVSRLQWQGECAICGEPGCDYCLERRNYGTAEAGYQDEMLLCGSPRCQEIARVR